MKLNSRVFQCRIINIEVDWDLIETTNIFPTGLFKTVGYNPSAHGERRNSVSSRILCSDQ